MGRRTVGRVREDGALIIRGAANSDIGKVRRQNQDAYGLFPDLALYVVADGVGGQPAGDTAAQLTVESIRRSLIETHDASLTPVTGPDGQSSEGAHRLLIAVQDANERVRDASRGDPRTKGMGTTVAAVFFDAAADLVAICHVGDSRVYRIRGERIEQLTDDHTLVQELLKAGKIGPDDAVVSSHRHLLTRAVGAEDLIHPELRLERSNPGDLFVLSSDGVHDVVSAAEILQVVRESRSELERACARLIELANERGGRDNSTVVILACESGSAIEPQPSVP